MANLLFSLGLCKRSEQEDFEIVRRNLENRTGKRLTMTATIRTLIFDKVADIRKQAAEAAEKKF